MERKISKNKNMNIRDHVCPKCSFSFDVFYTKHVKTKRTLAEHNYFSTNPLLILKKLKLSIICVLVVCLFILKYTLYTIHYTPYTIYQTHTWS